MNREQVRALFSGSTVFETNLSLVAYCKTIVKILGYILVEVQCNQSKKIKYLSYGIKERTFIRKGMD